MTPDSDDTGLDEATAATRLRDEGANVFGVQPRRGTLRAIGAVLREPMLLLLAAATGLYALLGEWRDAVAMGVSVAVVVGLDLYQGARSERALQALRALSAPKARVVRGGERRLIDAADVVVGDVLELAEGDRVPADARLLHDADVDVDESLLTGESVPVFRGIDARVLAGTFVVRGAARARVEATGARTELGRLGRTLGDVRRARSPLQRQIARLVRVFAAFGMLASLALLALQLARGAPWPDAVLAALTLAIANVPEEFPVVLSVMFALGAWRLARERALVRRPDAIETLGCVSALCTDKTGTLTENRMRVRALVVDGVEHALDDALPTPARDVLAIAAEACPVAPVDPMDVAVVDAAHACGLDARAAPLRHYPFARTCPMVANVLRDADTGGARRVACKGAPEAVAALCALDAGAHAALAASVAALAARGLRVLGVADGALHADAALPASPDGFALRWRGLLAIADPLRGDVPAAVREARDAGIRVLLVTGDHPATALAIAAEAGIAHAGAVITGDELARLDDAALAARMRGCGVYARVRPEQKLRLVQLLVAAGDVVAMTGDGVNDAPALAAAHVGIAMGGRGSDVAREAASIVLTDDRFPTILQAIRAGRRLHDNLVRAVQYILAVHVPIAGLALLPVVLGAPPVLMPVHVVLLELVIDPASTLVFDRRAAVPELMRRPPRRPDASLLASGRLGTALALGAACFAAAFAIYALAGAATPAARASQAIVAIVAGNVAVLVATARVGRDVAFVLAWAGAVLAAVALAAAVPAVASALHLGGLTVATFARAVAVATACVAATAWAATRMRAPR